MDLTKMDFSGLEPAEVRIDNLLGGSYILTEMSAAASAAYENRKMEGAVLDEDGTMARLTRLADLKPFAVSLCLLKLPDREPVTVQDVLSWPDRIVDPLYDRLVEISPTVFGHAKLEDLEKQLARVHKAIAAVKRRDGDPKGSPADGSATTSTAEE